jgi:DNA-directed RNA polymerase subunit omega
MARITIEDCTEQVPNHFTLVLMTSVRTKQLKRGSRPQVPPGENRAVVTALREIAKGIVQTDEAKTE